MCIVGARRMHLNTSLAIAFGILLSPFSGLVYGYMLLTADRNWWHIALVAIVSVFVLAALLASLNTARTVGNQTKTEQSTITTSVNPSTGSGSQTISDTPVESAQSNMQTTALLVAACQSRSSQCSNVPAVVRYNDTLDALGNRTLYLLQITLPDGEIHSYTQSNVVLGSHAHPTKIYDDQGNEWALSIL